MEQATLWATVDSERAGLADLAAGLRPDQMAARSVCSGWTVREVIAHCGMTDLSPGQALAGMVRHGFNLNRVGRETARRRAAQHSDAELVDLLRAMVGRRGHLPGVSVLDVLTDILVHGQDVAVPSGVHRPMPVEAATAAAQRAARAAYWS